MGRFGGPDCECGHEQVEHKTRSKVFDSPPGGQSECIRCDCLEYRWKMPAKPSVLFDTPPEKWNEKTMAVALAMCGTAADVARKVGAKIGHVDLVFDGEFKVRLEWKR